MIGTELKTKTKQYWLETQFCFSLSATGLQDTVTKKINDTRLPTWNVKWHLYRQINTAVADRHQLWGGNRAAETGMQRLISSYSSICWAMQCSKKGCRLLQFPGDSGGISWKINRYTGWAGRKQAMQGCRLLQFPGGIGGILLNLNRYTGCAGRKQAIQCPKKGCHLLQFPGGISSIPLNLNRYIGWAGRKQTTQGGH